MDDNAPFHLDDPLDGMCEVGHAKSLPNCLLRALDYFVIRIKVLRDNIDLIIGILELSVE